MLAILVTRLTRDMYDKPDAEFPFPSNAWMVVSRIRDLQFRLLILPVIVRPCLERYVCIAFAACKKKEIHLSSLLPTSYYLLYKSLGLQNTTFVT